MSTLSSSLHNGPDTRRVLTMDPSDCSSPLSEHHSASVSSPTQDHITALPSSVLPESPSSNCPLLSIPPELRLHIYEELFQVRKAKLCLGTFNGSWYRIDSTKGYNPKTRTTGHCVGIITTCKQIFAEAQPILCANTPLALYYSDSNPVDVETQSVDLTKITPNTQEVYICIELHGMQDLASEEVREILAPFVEVANNASRARELKIDLTIDCNMQGQQCLDWVMECLGNIESNAKKIMFMFMHFNDVLDGSGPGLNDESFTKLLKKFLRVDETSKVWQARLEWEKERHAYQTGRLSKFKHKIRRRKIRV